MADILQFARPEEVGVRPEWVSDYVRRMNATGKMCHSFLMMRHGKVFAEGYWKPFHKDWLHRMYSVSKSFVSGAVGLLIDEGKLSLDDRIADYFPELIPENPHPYIMEMTVRNLLMMATCHKENSYKGDDPAWLPLFFNPKIEPDHRAGTEFRYDTAATYTLDVLVQRLSGKDFMTYLKDKYLREVGFSEDAWCVESPDGYLWGGSGVECTTRDLARYALLFFGKGEVGGKRYLSREYAEAATAKQIDNSAYQDDASVNGHGYGYQIWRQWRNSFAFLGMGGQMAVCIPDKDFLFCCTSDMQGDADGYEVPIVTALWETVVDKLSDEELPMEDGEYADLKNLLSSLTVAVPAGAKDSPLEDGINGKRYVLADNPMGIREFTISFSGDAGKVVYRTERGDKEFPFRRGAYADTVFPETHYSGKRIQTPKGSGYRCLNAGVWKKEDTFLLRTYVIDDYFGNMAAVFRFAGDTVHLEMTKTAEWFLDEYVGTADGRKAKG